MLTRGTCKVAVSSYGSEVDKVVLYWPIFALRHRGESEVMGFNL